MRRLVIAAAIAMAALPVFAQGKKAALTAPVPPGAYKSSAEIMAVLDKSDAVSKTGASVDVAPGIGVRRRAQGSPQYAIIHPLSIEVYQIVDGSATLVTGGMLEGEVENPNPDNFRTLRVKGGEARKVAKGDVIVIPPGTPHWFSEINGSVTYLEVRVTTEK